MNTAPTHQLFSFSRWRLLVAKQWSEHHRRYLLSLLAIGGLYAVWFGFLIAIDVYAPMEAFMQFAAYMIGLYLVGCLFASMLFADLGTKKEALPWLSLPASHLEKLLCAILYGVILFFIAYTLIFYIVDILMVQWSNMLIERHPRNWPGTNMPIMPVKVYNPFTANGAPMPEKDNHLFSILYFSIQAIFLLGSIYFTRYSFIKTVIVVLLFVLGFTVLERGIIYPMLPNGWNNNFLSWSRPSYYAGPPVNELRLPGEWELFLTRLGLFGMPLFFWFVTYIRLKEKEA